MGSILWCTSLQNIGCYAIFASSFKSLDMKYAYHAMGCCDFSSKPSLSVYFCQKSENIWLASQISGTTHAQLWCIKGFENNASIV